jgi:hypothetical protein
MHGGSPVIVLGMDAKVYKCGDAAAFTDRSSVPMTFAVAVFEKYKNLLHTKYRRLANVHSAGLHSFVVSRSTRLRPATHTNHARGGETFLLPWRKGLNIVDGTREHRTFAVPAFHILKICRRDKCQGLQMSHPLL